MIPANTGVLRREDQSLGNPNLWGGYIQQVLFTPPESMLPWVGTGQGS